METATESLSDGGPLIVKGPWTAGARQNALEGEVVAHFADYLRRTAAARNWSPLRLPVAEMEELGGRLSPETSDLVEGFLGVEEHVGDYVSEGLEVFRDDRTRRNLQLSWGADEAKHGVAWELVLKHSGARTNAQLETFLDKVREHRWSIDAHAEAHTPLGATVYSMVQERATYFHYQQTRARIRKEYGLPTLPTARELERGCEVGASEAFRVVARDELAHHTIFLQIVRSHIRYFPSATFDVLSRVLADFEMPSIRSLPNVRRFLRAVSRTQMYGTSVHQEKVERPVLHALGLGDAAGFEKMRRDSSELPEDVQRL